MSTSAETAYAIGVDLGGTKTETALVDAKGRIAGRQRTPTEAALGPDHVIETVVSMLETHYLQAPDRPVCAIGVGVAGQVDSEQGIVRRAPNLDWRNYPIRERLEAAVGLPVAVLNDVQAITYGECRRGIGRGASNLVCVFAGTGVGGGIVIGGELVRGASGNAGEFGHMTIERDGPLCSCGNRGCLEAFVGGWAIARRARERAAAEPDGAAALLRLAGGAPADITAALVGEAAAHGDAFARALVEDTGAALGVGLAAIANALNPELIILGGGIVEGLPDLVEIAEQELRRRALAAALQPLRVVRSKLGADAGVIGAALFARETTREREVSGRGLGARRVRGSTVSPPEPPPARSRTALARRPRLR
ncbi:MAG TPA: ROK family protein [Stellaceae bacterium]|jgi:glucokinase|nr:ROK family protein [Stellaceae bacterium]